MLISGEKINLIWFSLDADCVSLSIFLQILKPSEKKAKYQYVGMNSGRPSTPQRVPPPPANASNKKK